MNSGEESSVRNTSVTPPNNLQQLLTIAYLLGGARRHRRTKCQKSPHSEAKSPRPEAPSKAQNCLQKSSLTRRQNCLSPKGSLHSGPRTACNSQSSTQHNGHHSTQLKSPKIPLKKPYFQTTQVRSQKLTSSPHSPGGVLE